MDTVLWEQDTHLDDLRGTSKWTFSIMLGISVVSLTNPSFSPFDSWILGSSPSFEQHHLQLTNSKTHFEFLLWCSHNRNKIICMKTDSNQFRYICTRHTFACEVFTQITTHSRSQCKKIEFFLWETKNECTSEMKWIAKQSAFHFTSGLDDVWRYEILFVSH